MQNEFMIELVQKGFRKLKSALERFKVQTNEICYICSEADNVFSYYMENGLYDKIDNVCENDLFDEVINFALNGSEYNVDKYLNQLLDEEKEYIDSDRKVIICFFHKIYDIIIDAQIKYGIKDPDNKVISKQIQQIKSKLDIVVPKIEEQTINDEYLIGILACNNNDPRTQELLSLNERDLLNLNEFNGNLNDVDKIKTRIELFKNSLESSKTYQVKMVCSYSIAFIIGAIFTQKIDNLIFINRDNKWRFGLADKIKLNCKTIHDGSSIKNIAISIGTTSYIDDDVLSYIDQKQTLICIHYDKHIQTSGQFNAIGNELTKKLKKIASNSNGPLNIFYRGPVEVMFLLGQKSNDFGQCTIYEFDFRERDLNKRTYIKGITF